MPECESDAMEWPLPKPFVRAVCDHIDRTGEPETAPGIHHGPFEKSEPFLIVQPISVPRSRRADGKLAPCPMCQPNKFLDGRLVWFERLKAVAVIGHCCASSETNRAAELEFRIRVARERAQDFLLENLLALPVLRQRCEAIRKGAADAQKAFDDFKANGRPIQQLLRRAAKGTGRLTVSEVVGKLDGDGPSARLAAGSTVQTQEVDFGPLAGIAATKDNCAIGSDFDHFESIVSEFSIHDTDDKIEAFILQLDDAGLRKNEAKLREAVEGIDALPPRIADIASFFTEVNARRISAWGAHRDAPEWTKAEIKTARLEGRVLFEIETRNRRAGVLIPADFLKLEVWSPNSPQSWTK